MTAPMPPSSSSGRPDRDQRDQHPPAQHDQPATPWAAPEPAASGPGHPPGDGAPAPVPPPVTPRIGREVAEGAIVAVAVTVTGVLLGVLWAWLAPRVPLIVSENAVYLKDSEGEEAVGADGVFVLLALGLGALAGAVLFWLRRHGGVGLVIGLAVGAVLASVLAWRLGVWLGPTQDVAAHAREVGPGKVFDAPLELRAKGALLAWPVAAVVAHLALTALWGPREEPEDVSETSSR